MFNILLADIVFGIDNKYNYIEQMCEDYICCDEAQVVISVTDSEISAEGQGDLSYLESLAIYRKIAEKIVDMNGFLLHGVLAETKGQGIAFLAKSGVGKSTHAALWQEVLGIEFCIINGDKPLLRIIDDKVYAYGTPWAGKEKLQKNTRTELKKICFIERAEQNSCSEISKEKVLEKLLAQIYRPKSGEKIAAVMDLLEKVICSVQFYIIRCNKDISAARTAIDTVMESSLSKALRDNGMYITTTRGNSMYPMLSAGTKVLITRAKRPIKKYDVVVYQRGDHYTMHRVIKVTKGGLVIRADNRTYKELDITEKDILGILSGFYRGAEFVDADSKEFKQYAKRACLSFPVRKIKEKILRTFH